MPLSPPAGFPEAYWLPVVAAEAKARLGLIADLAKIDWMTAGHTRYLHWDDVKKAALQYLASTADAFAEQACRAATSGDLPLARLDATIENFVDNVMHHAYFGLDLPKIRATWELSRHSSFASDMRQRVMAAPWHLRYLAQVPEVLASTTKPERALSQLAERRRLFVQPKLEASGLTVSSWADRAGVDPSVAYDYMNGKTNPRADSRRALAETLKVPVNELPE